jgi:hypothetical protein
MACPECEATRAHYLAMRRAVISFAHTLNQLEHERLVQVDAVRPAGAPSMVELRAAMERDAELTLSDLPAVREVRG